MSRKIRKIGISLDGAPLYAVSRGGDDQVIELDACEGDERPTTVAARLLDSLSSGGGPAWAQYDSVHGSSSLTLCVDGAIARVYRIGDRAVISAEAGCIIVTKDDAVVYADDPGTAAKLRQDDPDSALVAVALLDLMREGQW